MSYDRTDQDLEAAIGEAKQRIARVASERRSWTAFDLKKAARNGWSSSTMGLALHALLEEGVLVRDSDEGVRTAQTPRA